ncbi:hypothetical protein P153DRAFT_373325 [Dothidotthia symphoricarpi CBS 119687]|uniref:C2H2-type domain-containing protein n=1 Tax=Dothidotthia symphoricarpi CBS 119687 TaxID=1392245 RepID=A0A6A6AN46_9PLEO|nr:uncharacterized protein P153DRAFT_373325 [Dothidotthia symphoricarpi CBS 119687]KAF2132603.1 hypothetical protein P153DRAFT_373325 [Dothidotthia symphoricarpi CBS 119687]
MSAPIGQNPRRRSTRVPSALGMQLRKSGTFSSPQSLSTDICDLENQPFMPRRSPTSTESLEALLQDPSVSRVANLLKDFDKKIAGHRAASTTEPNLLNDPEVLPVPSFLLENATLGSTPMDIDSKPSAVERNPHDHASDSGLGTSISGLKDGKDLPHLPAMSTPLSNAHKDNVSTQTSRESISTSVSSTHSAITRSFSAMDPAEDKHILGEYACRQIRESIIDPILREADLKDFHPLIKDVPRRIGEKNICNLRDLEKTLIFLAPEFSATPSSYERFCVRSITLLHTAINRFSEQDQRLPTDRPYTNNYFLDLMEQIRRYAAIMAATREKEANGEDLDNMDYSRDEKITLRGGLSHNGRPVELVREKNGQVISLATGVGKTKRALTDDEMDEDEATRSMARRRKSEKPGDVLHLCRDCKKEFKRPCDLTKHEKTHSRPWKCSEAKCKYFEFGWPTEKERDRHINDKHSAAPAQYKCLYPPCTYASKRESNCKQHMEKAHGWEYVRSKSNGRKKALTHSDCSPTTPLTPFLDTPQSLNLTTPITPFAPSPQLPLVDTFNYYEFGTPAVSLQGFQDDFRRDSVTTDGSPFTYSSGYSPPEPTSFDDAVTPEDTAINHNDVFNNNCGFGTNFALGFQQPTPALSTTFDFEPLAFSTNPTLASGLPHLSPLAQPDVTLFSPQMQMHVDEGFGDGMEMDMQAFSRPVGDFELFGGAQSNNIALDSNTTNFFPDFNSLGGQFSNLYPTALDEFMGNTDDLMGNNFSNL